MGIVHARQMVQLRFRPFWKHVTFKTFQRTLGACSSEHGSLRDSLSRERCFSLGILRALERRFCSQAYARHRSFEDRGDLLDTLILGQTSSFFAILLSMTPFCIFDAKLLKGLFERQVTRPSAQLRAPSNMMSRERPVLNCKRSNIIDDWRRMTLASRLQIEIAEECSQQCGFAETLVKVFSLNT